MADVEQLEYHKRLKRRTEAAQPGMSMSQLVTASRALRWIGDAIDGEVSQWHIEVEGAADDLEAILFELEASEPMEGLA